ncbi:MAG: L-aspartate 1-decarboxylase [Desulfatitalea sp. BRH_c12]|nr:MAG: L-aspartate 1-decarboxylase [Desulfatitalea sp. BRH_c12]
MFVNMFKGKVHRATVTEADLNYVGSITIDQTLLKAAGILPGEKVQVVNINNGCRFETYTLEGPADSGVICINGAAARLAHTGDKVIIIAYCWLDAEEAKAYKPAVIFVDDRNTIIPSDKAPKHSLTLL